MDRRFLRLEFSAENVRDPVVYEMGRQFGVSTNIIRANIGREGGWAILELDGDADDVASAVEWARARGVTVEPASEEQVG